MRTSATCKNRAGRSPRKSFSVFAATYVIQSKQSIFIYFSSSMRSTIIIVILLATTCTSQRCTKTNLEGPQKNRSCIFPFTVTHNHLNFTYNECTGNHEIPGRLWCSTKVDDFGNHVINQTEWGYCDPSKKSFIFNISLCLHTPSYICINTSQWFSLHFVSIRIQLVSWSMDRRKKNTLASTDITSVITL